MNFFLLLQIAIKGNLRRWTGKARLWYGAAMSKLPDSISIVDISMEACDTAIADLQMQGVVETVLVASLADIAIQTTVAERV